MDRRTEAEELVEAEYQGKRFQMRKLLGAEDKKATRTVPGNYQKWKK
ncbi:MAG: hypothetical protein KAW39_03500 [Thermoplasmata archaeon]|nr:hypothetical protein [Thermoplasmata archaeon]